MGSIKLEGIAGRGEKEEHTNPAYFHNVELVVYKDNKKLKLNNAWTIKTEVGFAEKDFAVAGVLGVRGFLDQFAFKANIPEGYFELEPLFEIGD